MPDTATLEPLPVPTVVSEAFAPICPALTVKRYPPSPTTEATTADRAPPDAGRSVGPHGYAAGRRISRSARLHRTLRAVTSSGRRPEQKIDAAVALMMAVGRAMAEDAGEGDLGDFLRDPAHRLTGGHRLGAPAAAGRGQPPDGADGPQNFRHQRLD